MAYNDPYGVLAEKIRRVASAADLDEVPREDIDAFLNEMDAAPFDKETARRILRKTGVSFVTPKNGARQAAKPKCRLGCEQLEDRLPPSTFWFSLVTERSEPVEYMSARGTGRAEPPAVRFAPAWGDVQGGEMRILGGGECGLAANTEGSHLLSHAESFSLVFARTDYQDGAGFSAPGAPGEELQHVLAWNLLTAQCPLESADAFALQTA